MLIGMAETPISRWLREEMPRRGYPLEGPRAGGISRLADDADISRASLSRVVAGQAELSIEALRKIGAVFKISLPTMMRHAGLLDPDEIEQAGLELGTPTASVVDARALTPADHQAALLTQPPPDAPPEIAKLWPNYTVLERQLWWLQVPVQVRWWLSEGLSMMVLSAAAEAERRRAEAARNHNGDRAAG